MAALRQVLPGLFVIRTGIVNTFLIDAPDGCVLVDAGMPGCEADILRGVAAAGRRPTDVRHLIVTHAHPDHIGSLATVRAATGAAVYCHPADAPIVAAGGYYLHATYPPEVAEKSEDELARKLMSDAAAQRWGAMGEIGVSQHPMYPDEKKVLRAVCKTNLQTGLPIFTHNPHNGCSACAVEQMDTIESMGVNPAHVCIGHLADITDDPKAETHKSLAKRGAFLGFDTVGRRLTQPDSKKLEMVLAVIDAGYEDHVLLGSDFATEDELKANHGAGFDSAMIVFVPKMRAAGVKEETIHKILIDNPRRFLAFVPKKTS